MLLKWPVIRLSTTLTLAPISINALERFEPMNPAPPVTNTVFPSKYVLNFSNFDITSPHGIRFARSSLL